MIRHVISSPRTQQRHHTMSLTTRPLLHGLHSTWVCNHCPLPCAVLTEVWWPGFETVADSLLAYPFDSQVVRSAERSALAILQANLKSVLQASRVQWLGKYADKARSSLCVCHCVAELVSNQKHVGHVVPFATTSHLRRALEAKLGKIVADVHQQCFA